MTKIKEVGYITEGKVEFKQPTSFRDNVIYLRNNEIRALVDIVENGANLQVEFSEGKLNSMEYMRISKALLDGEFYVYQEEPKRYYIKLYDDFEGYLTAYGFGFDKDFHHDTKEEGFGKQTTFTMEEIAELKQWVTVQGKSLEKCLEPVE